MSKYQGKYQRDPNKDYNIEIIVSSTDNPAEKIKGFVKLSQLKQLEEFNIDGLKKLLAECVIHAERAEADKLEQEYTYFGSNERIEDLPQV